jgi:hypothetical protein
VQMCGTRGKRSGNVDILLISVSALLLRTTPGRALAAAGERLTRTALRRLGLLRDASPHAPPRATAQLAQGEHTPSTHESAGSQTTPQPPQFWESVLGSTQISSHVM